MDALYCKLDSNATSAKYVLGKRVVVDDPVYGTRAYRYIKSADTLAAGDALGSNGTLWNVTHTLPSSPAHCVIGVAIGVITTLYYGFMQVAGYCTTITTESATAVPNTAIYGTAGAATGTINAGSNNATTGDLFTAKYAVVATTSGASKTTMDGYLVTGL